MGKIKWSGEQKAVLKSVVKFKRNIMCTAVAGAGKTTLTIKCVEIIREHNPTASILVMAFNKDIAVEIKNKMSHIGDIQSSTFHSWCMGIVNRTFKKRPQINPAKAWQTIKGLAPDAGGRLIFLVNKTRELGIIETDPDKLHALMFDQWNDFFKLKGAKFASKGEERLFKLVCNCLEAMDSHVEEMDFNDMIRFVRLFDLLKRNKKLIPDFLIVDEFQDLDDGQISILDRMMVLKPSMRILASGDPLQELYSFRGCVDSINKVMAKASDIGAKEYPLTNTYRVPSVVVDAVKARIPESVLVANKDGGKFKEHKGKRLDGYCIEKITKYINKVGEDSGPFIISPKNKHLVRVGLALKNKGFKVSFKDSGALEDIRVMIKRQNAKTVFQLLKRLERIGSGTGARTKEKDDKDIAQSAMFFIMHISPKEVSDVLETITSYKRKDDGSGVLLKTVHSSKGLESDMVIVIDDFFKTEVDLQKTAMEYVSMTRTLDVLVMIDPHKSTKKVLKAEDYEMPKAIMINGKPKKSLGGPVSDKDGLMDFSNKKKGKSKPLVGRKGLF